MRRRFSHLANHSGYDRLFHYINQHVDPVFNYYKPSNFPYLIAERLRINWLNQRKLQTVGLQYPTSTLVQRQLKKIVRKKDIDLIHIGYFEDDSFLNDHFTSIYNTKIIATVHQPPSWWKLNADPSLVKHLDGLITLTRAAQSFFEPFLPDKVHYFPLGVDTVFYHPDLNFKKEKQKKCLFVGQWLRDIPYLIQVVEKLLQHDSTIEFDIVYPRKKRFEHYELYRIARYPQVNWHSDISDSALRTLYQRANLLILPLLDCCANNTILESMACGLPILTSNIEGVKSYIDPSFSVVCDVTDPSDMSNKAIEMINKPRILSDMSVEARIYAKKYFDWMDVSKKVNNFYHAVLGE